MLENRDGKRDGVEHDVRSVSGSAESSHGGFGLGVAGSTGGHLKSKDIGNPSRKFRGQLSQLEFKTDPNSRFNQSFNLYLLFFLVYTYIYIFITFSVDFCFPHRLAVMLLTSSQVSVMISSGIGMNEPFIIRGKAGGCV